MTPSILARYDVSAPLFTATELTMPVYGSITYRSTLDITGGNLPTLPEHIALRLACIVYSCVMPISGLRDAYENLVDNYKWNTQSPSIARQPDRESVFVASSITETKARPMVLDED